MKKNYDLAVIGGGPGGYVCAIRAAQLGLNVALVERRSTLGGTCVNVGCIPSKALLDSSHKFQEVKYDLAEHGIQCGEPKLDLKQMMARKQKIVQELTSGLDYLIKKNKIHRYYGEGSLENVTSDGVEIRVLSKDDNKKGAGTNSENVQQIEAKYCVIATGSKSIQLANVAVDEKHIISSDQGIALTTAPKKMAIIGGGVIALELGSVWNRLGSEVTIIETLPNILGSLDQQISEAAQHIYKQQGLQFLLGTQVVEAKVKAGKGVEVKLGSGIGQSMNKDTGDDKERGASLLVDKLLVAVGRRPCTDALFQTESFGININERGRIEVDPLSLQTAASRVYAIGDVIEGPMLAHRAEEEGIMVAECLAGIPARVNYQAMPWVVYTWPEIAWVGRSEQELKQEGISYHVGRSLFKSNGRAKAMNEAEGMIKILADKRDDRILGVFILGPTASELIGEAVIAMEFGASAEDIARSFHAHPTLTEVLKEAALGVDKRSLHS